MKRPLLTICVLVASWSCASASQEGRTSTKKAKSNKATAGANDGERDSKGKSDEGDDADLNAGGGKAGGNKASNGGKQGNNGGKSPLSGEEQPGGKNGGDDKKDKPGSDDGETGDEGGQDDGETDAPASEGAAANNVYHSACTGSGETHWVDRTESISVETLEVTNDNATITVNKTQSHSSDRHVDESLQKGLGASVFTKVDAKAAKIPVANRILAWASSKRLPNGEVVEFGQAVPVMVYPTSDCAAYAKINKGQPLVIDTSATVGGARTSMHIVVTANGCSVSIQTTMAENDKGSMEGKFCKVMPDALTYTNNPQSKMIEGIDSRACYDSEATDHPTPGIPGGFPGGGPPGFEDQLKQFAHKQPNHVAYRCAKQ